MGGTILGVLTALSYMVAAALFYACAEMGFLHKPFRESSAEFDMRANELRLYRVVLLMLCNLFFIEWAYDDYVKLRRNSKKLTCCQLLS